MSYHQMQHSFAGIASYRCRIVRNILADKPRVTKFPIEFDGPAEGEALPVAGDMLESQQQQVGTRAWNEACSIRPFQAAERLL